MNLLVILAVFYCMVVVLPIEQEQEELVLVSIIFRHGAKTPQFTYPKDPYKKQTFYPYGQGGLTNKGKMQAYVLGKYLRQNYGDFIGNWSEEKVWIRSTHSQRTIMSAQLVLAGLFPPKGDLIWNKNLLWHPIPVNYKQHSTEDLFPAMLNCPRRTRALENLVKTRKITKKFMKPYKKLFQYVSRHSGAKITNSQELLSVYSILESEESMGLPLPRWTNSVYPEEMKKVTSVLYIYQNSDAAVKRINCGYILKKILNDCNSKMKNEYDTRKIYLYSGHESVLGYIIYALNITVPHVPLYSSALLFELIRKNTKFFVKIRYKATDGMEARDVVLSGCSVQCPYKKFVSILHDRYLIPSVSMEEACYGNIWGAVTFYIKVCLIGLILTILFVYVLVKYL